MWETQDLWSIFLGKPWVFHIFLYVDLRTLGSWVYTRTNIARAVPSYGEYGEYPNGHWWRWQLIRA